MIDFDALEIAPSILPDDLRAALVSAVGDEWVRDTPMERVVHTYGKSIRDLVRNSLRMRPDRIVVGECRGGEALDMLQAMNTGHDGSISTLHANSPRDAMSRLETLVLMAGMDLPLRAIREQAASAVDLIVQIQRLRDGSRRVVNVTEVMGMEGDVVVLQDVFTFEIGVVREQLIDRPAGADLGDNHANGHTHASDGRLTAHQAWDVGDAIQWFHGANVVDFCTEVA